MRSPFPDAPARTRARARQSGYSLMEVMIASVIISIMVLGLGGFWYRSVGTAYELVLRQKAIFVLNAEMERISALYTYTDFADCGFFCSTGPVSTTGYDGLATIPSPRYVYPSNVSDYTGGTGDYVTTNVTTFNSTEFHVWLDSNVFTSSNRTYVWIDKARTIVGRLSWTKSTITPASCTTDCSCQAFDGSGDDNCLVLSVYIEYPYKFLAAGGVTAPAASDLKTISLKTIVGRGDA